MVQEKDAAKKRVAARREHLDSLRKNLDENTLKFRWCVIEHTPAYEEFGYYSSRVEAKNRRVSEFFDTEIAAEGWMDRHEPDKGNSLHVQRQRLVRREYTEWVTY